MTDAKNVEALLKLVEISWHAHSERRAIEWKINFDENKRSLSVN